MAVVRTVTSTHPSASTDVVGPARSLRTSSTARRQPGSIAPASRSPSARSENPSASQNAWLRSRLGGMHADVAVELVDRVTGGRRTLVAGQLDRAALRRRQVNHVQGAARRGLQ